MMRSQYAPEDRETYVEFTFSEGGNIIKYAGIRLS